MLIKNMGFIKKIIEIGKRRKSKGNLPPGVKQCVACRGIIDDGVKRTKQMGLHFHLSCWKSQKKASL